MASTALARAGGSSRPTAQPLTVNTSVIQAMRKAVKPIVMVKTSIALKPWTSIAATVSVLYAQRQ